MSRPVAIGNRNESRRGGGGGGSQPSAQAQRRKNIRTAPSFQHPPSSTLVQGLIRPSYHSILRPGSSPHDQVIPRQSPIITTIVSTPHLTPAPKWRRVRVRRKRDRSRGRARAASNDSCRGRARVRVASSGGTDTASHESSNDATDEAEARGWARRTRHHRSHLGRGGVSSGGSSETAPQEEPIDEESRPAPAPQASARSAVADQARSSDEESRHRSRDYDLPGVTHYDSEPDIPCEFPTVDNFNIMINLAVVSYDVPMELKTLTDFVENNPAHLLILVWEDPADKVVDAFMDWAFLHSDSIQSQPSYMNTQLGQRQQSKKDVTNLGRGMWAITHRGYVYSCSMQACVDRSDFAITGMVLKLRKDRQEWPIIVCRFPRDATEIPPTVMKHFATRVDGGGSVMAVGLFGNTGPQLRQLFGNKGSGDVVRQTWLVDGEPRVYPAYWVFLADHKQKHLKPEDAVVDYERLRRLDCGTGLRPFEAEMIKVSDVPSWVSDDIQVRDGEPYRGHADGPKVGTVRPKPPAFEEHWVWGLYQHPLWLGGSRTGKKASAKRKASKRKNEANRRARQAAEHRAKQDAERMTRQAAERMARQAAQRNGKRGKHAGKHWPDIRGKRDERWGQNSGKRW